LIAAAADEAARRDWFRTRRLPGMASLADRHRDLLTQRWRGDPVEASVDPNHDGNAFSFYSYSRLDFHLAGGGVFDCENLRDGCPGLTASDGYPGDYSYVQIDTTADRGAAGSGPSGSGHSPASGPGQSLRRSSSLSPCAAVRPTRIALGRWHGRAITGVVVYLDGRRVFARRARTLRMVSLPALAGTRAHHIRVVEYVGEDRVRTVRRTVHGCRRR